MRDLDATGYALAELVLTSEQCAHIASSLPAVSGGRGGVRNLITHPTVLRLLMHESFGRYVWSVVGRELVAVKATLFDKTPASNWRARWHQDRMIAVRERIDIAGYGPWTSKAGTLHVEPPAAVLQQMLAVRIHLDDCGPEDGPLRVIPGSHDDGKLADDALLALVDNSAFAELYAPQGAMLFMRPLLVHASSPANGTSHRRVLHVELAPAEAISPLQWQNAIVLKRH